MRIMTSCLVVSPAGLIALGCGSSESMPGARCGQPSGVPGQVIIVQEMSCSEALSVAKDYYESGKAPGMWSSRGPAATSGWQCNGRLPQALEPAIAQCASFSMATSAQDDPAEVFEVRP